jgi:hypothetical protein
LIWLCWFWVLLALSWLYGVPLERLEGITNDIAPLPVPSADPSTLAVVVVQDTPPDSLFPWLVRSRWRKWALVRYQALA